MEKRTNKLKVFENWKIPYFVFCSLDIGAGDSIENGEYSLTGVGILFISQ